MDYTTVLNDILTALNNIIRNLSDLNIVSYLVVGIITINLVLNAIKGE